MNRGPRIVSDVMSHTVIAVGRTAPFGEIARTLEQWRVGALPVVQGEQRVVGIVSETDLLPPDDGPDAPPDRRRPATVPARRAPATAEDLMTSPAVTVRPGATVAQAVRLLARHHVARLPVVDEFGRLQGIVTRRDLAALLPRDDAELAARVRETVVAPLVRRGRGVLEVHVRDGVVTLSGVLADPDQAPLLLRRVRTVDGVLDARFTPAPARPDTP